MTARRCLPLLLLSTLVLASCSSDTTGPETVVPADVDKYLELLPDWETFSPPEEPANVQVTEPEAFDETYDGVDYTCTSTTYSLTDTPDDIVVFSPDSEILWVGALLQGDGYARGLGSLEELPIRQRAPLTVFIDLLTENVTRTVVDPDAASVAAAVGALIQAAEDAGHEAGSSIFFDQIQTHSLAQASLDLSISANYLGTRVTSELSYDETVDENTLTAYFLQKMFTVNMVLPQTPSEMFSDAFTQDRLQEQVNLGRMGPDNLPTYISNIVYGRMLMLTMTSSYSFQEMEAALTASRESIGSGSIDGSYLEVLEASQIRVSTVGGVDEGVENLIKSGQLGQYFSASAPLTSARPLSYTVRNLGDNSIAKVSETTIYDITECSAVPQEATGARYRITLDKLRLIERGCDGIFDPNPEVYYNFVLHTDSGNITLANRSAANAVVMEEGGELALNTFPARSTSTPTAAAPCA
ncbi:MAG: thiol-activated cytolysin family protein [Candidatus Krumholzibacteriia bacterium]